MNGTHNTPVVGKAPAGSRQVRQLRALPRPHAKVGTAGETEVDAGRHNPCNSGYFNLCQHGRDTDAEIEQLESAVTADLRFDYSESELTFWFDYGPHSSDLCVRLREVQLL